MYMYVYTIFIEIMIYTCVVYILTTHTLPTTLQHTMSTQDQSTVPCTGTLHLPIHGVQHQHKGEDASSADSSTAGCRASSQRLYMKRG